MLAWLHSPLLCACVDNQRRSVASDEGSCLDGDSMSSTAVLDNSDAYVTSNRCVKLLQVLLACSLPVCLLACLKSLFQWNQPVANVQYSATVLSSMSVSVLSSWSLSSSSLSSELMCVPSLLPVLRFFYHLIALFGVNPGSCFSAPLSSVLRCHRMAVRKPSRYWNTQDLW